ncbi:MAG: hypothetical protein NWQ06_07905, partial [Leeuwenhoekiella sp.]|nr:hypothetical protein [Leeuwenhoekiella sp.]
STSPASVNFIPLSTKILSKQDLKDLDFNTITEDFQFKSGISTARGETFFEFDFSPIFYENKILKRVEAFRIEYSEQRLKSNRSAVLQETKNSVLASGAIYKFYVEKTGIYKLDKSFLESLGMNVNAINPQNLKIYGNGGAMLPLRNADNLLFIRILEIKKPTRIVAGAKVWVLEENKSNKLKFGEKTQIAFHAMASSPTN